MAVGQRISGSDEALTHLLDDSSNALIVDNEPVAQQDSFQTLLYLVPFQRSVSRGSSASRWLRSILYPRPRNRPSQGHEVRLIRYKVAGSPALVSRNRHLPGAEHDPDPP